MINGSNLYDKPDTKKKDSEPDIINGKSDTMKKDAKKKDSKPDTNVKDKPDTKAKDKPDTKMKDKSDTKVKDKPDIKVKDKEDIESSASKNESQKSLSNGELAKTLDYIKKIFRCFGCEKFINIKFRLRGQNKGGITLCPISKPDKHYKTTHGIVIYGDAISLNTEKKTKGMKHVNSIYLEDKKIILKASQAQDNGGIQKIVDMSISIYNDKITSNISMMTNDNHNFIKHINEEIKCTSKIRYTILMKVICSLIKVCKKKEDEDSNIYIYICIYIYIYIYKDGYINKIIE